MQGRLPFAFFSTLLIMLFSLFSPASGRAGLPVPPLPPLFVPAPPPVILVPGSYVYFAPDVDVDILFFHGYWYRPYGGRWYRSSFYNGPWGFVPARRVPRALINLPPGYRNVPPGHERIPYGQLKGNWRSWEKERHWDKPGQHGAAGKKGKRRAGEAEEGGGHGHGRGR